MTVAADSDPRFRSQVLVLQRQRDAARSVTEARNLLVQLGFEKGTAFLSATAVSELATNIINHAGTGRLSFRGIENGGRIGFEVVAEDDGPGIRDFQLACTEGYSTAGSLGLGLAGVLRIMDEVEFDADRAVGTRIRAVRWR